jgi:magnesium transporter
MKFTEEDQESALSANYTIRLVENWPELSSKEKVDLFNSLPHGEAEELFYSLSAEDQWELLALLAPYERRHWLRSLPPDDLADLVQAAPEDQKYDILRSLDDKRSGEVMALLAYAEDEAGGLMTPLFLRLKPDMTMEQAIHYLRLQVNSPVGGSGYAYVLDPDQVLVGVISLKELLLAPKTARIQDIMSTKLTMLTETIDQEDVGRIFAESGLHALPVVDHDGRMKGVVTIDDAVEAVAEEATEDIQKMGGMEALEHPYLKVSFFEMIRKRIGWLAILFVGETLTASAMSYYEEHISKVVALALFIPLIISSGGNSGSQASTLIIRALALKEIRLKDWKMVFLRELASGLTFGLVLSLICLLRIVFWPSAQTIYGDHYLLIGIVVSLSVAGVVIWGTVTGAMLPFILRGVGLDPASASTPFVATLVDVTGVTIYFSIAALILGGSLL